MASVIVKRVVCTALMLLLAGCAGLTGHLERPTLSLMHLDLVHAQLIQQTFRARIAIHNPNNVSLPVRQVSLTLDCDGERVGTGQSVQPFLVGASADSQFEVDLSTNLAPIVLKLMGRLKDGNLQTAYRMSGTVTTDLALLRTIPFEVKGTF